MSCFSVGTVEILGQEKWVVERGSIQVGGPFDTKGAAEELRQEMESALAEAIQKAAEQSSEFDERTKPNGEFVATPTFINKHYVIFNEGRNSLRIFARRPFDDEKIELTLGTQIHFKFINGLVKSMDKEIDSGRGSGRSS
ncbi:MAG: hypothetical protein U0989_02480 [Azonexus sp.]|nr:hypothetical protein [Azonexus sp.]MDZ4313632.1 hypothetical protein [Azonexus sp.]